MPPWGAQHVLALDKVLDANGKAAESIFQIQRWAEAPGGLARAPLRLRLLEIPKAQTGRRYPPA